jgi:type IV secretory pathway VirB10-like protein
MANIATVPKDTTAERLIAMLKTALGPFVADLLSDEKVTELILNQDGKLWAGAASNMNQAGQRITEKNLNLQPTIETDPGAKINILTKDMILKPYTD